MTISFTLAAAEDAAAIAALRTEVAGALTTTYGKGHWSSGASEQGILAAMKRSRVVVARSRRRLVATVELATRKPWAIDAATFSACKRPLYMTSMAVATSLQHTGIGRRLIEHSKQLAKEWPADAIRLDAYDAAAGAGEFYRKCGFREVGRVSYRNVPLVYYEMLLD